MENGWVVLQAMGQGLWIGFCTAALIGPVNFMAVRLGLMKGFSSVLLTGSGSALVDAVCAYGVFIGLLKIGFFGIGKIFLWGLGAVFILYLLYAVWLDLRENPETLPSLRMKHQVEVMERPFLLGLLLAGSNPYTLIYWIGAVSALQGAEQISPTGRAATSFFSSVFVGEIIWFVFLGWALHHSRNLLDRKLLGRISFGCGVLLIGYAVFMVSKIVWNLVATGGTPAVPGG